MSSLYGRKKEKGKGNKKFIRVGPFRYTEGESIAYCDTKKISDKARQKLLYKLRKAGIKRIKIGNLYSNI